MRRVSPTTENLPLSPSPARIRSTIASVVDQPDELRELRIVHKALADVNRLRIVQRLAVRRRVRDRADRPGRAVAAARVSWHVGRLRAAGLVATRRNGRETTCRLRPEAFEAFVARERAILGLAGPAQARHGAPPRERLDRQPGAAPARPRPRHADRASRFGRLGLTPEPLTLIGFGIAIVAAVAAGMQAWLVAGRPR